MVCKKEIYNKITSVLNTQKITKAMEMVSASKMSKAKERMLFSNPYAKKINKIINQLVLNNLGYKHPYLNTRNINSIGYLVIGTDRGLVGSLNTNLFKILLKDIHKWSNQGVEIKLALIGSKAISFFNKTNNKVLVNITGIGDAPTLSKLIKPIEIMLQSYDEGFFDRLYIVSNKFINTMSQIPQIVQLLPFLPLRKAFLNKKFWDYLYEPEPKILLNILFRRYIESQIYQSVVENLVSEQAARMVTMKTATDNGNRFIKELKLTYNKVRQANVTQELAEIISGVN